MRIAIRFQGPNGPLVFECRRRDYPASFEVAALVRKHARRLGTSSAENLTPVVFLNREVQRPEDLLAVDAGEAKVVCAKLNDGAAAPRTPADGVPLGIPKVQG